MAVQPSAVSFPAVRFLMDPTPAQLRRDVILLEQKIKDYNKPLQYSKQIIIGSTRRAFLTETDPVTDIKWQQLSDRASREPHMGILRRVETNARLYRAMVNKYNYGVTRQGVYLNQSRIPFYAVYHQQDDSKGVTVQQGLKAMGIRTKNDLAKMARARATLSGHDLKHHVNEILHEARSGEHVEGHQSRIPRRRFIGMTLDSEPGKQIIGTFDAWAEEAITIYKRGNVLVRRRI